MTTGAVEFLVVLVSVARWLLDRPAAVMRLGAVLAGPNARLLPTILNSGPTYTVTDADTATTTCARWGMKLSSCRGALQDATHVVRARM